MLVNRIIATIRFFDLQNFPLTANEIHQFLINDTEFLQTKIDGNFELQDQSQITHPKIHLDTILTQLHILSREGRLEQRNGFYCLQGRGQIIEERLQNYLYGLRREKLIRRYAGFAKHLPFVRSIALLGSQAMGQQKSNSDIDLFVITDPNYIGLARFFLTSYFQILGVRRHGQKIANRFCLNHYLAGPVNLSKDRNLYTAYEYLKARVLVNQNIYNDFLEENDWVYLFFPNAERPKSQIREQASRTQLFLEKLFNNKLGHWLEQKMLNAQLARIEQSEFTISSDSEMSFHPDNRKKDLFQRFFEHQELNHRKME